MEHEMMNNDKQTSNYTCNRDVGNIVVDFHYVDVYCVQCNSYVATCLEEDEEMYELCDDCRDELNLLYLEQEFNILVEQN